MTKLTKLPHTERVQALIRQGKIDDAKTVHNRRVREQLDRAKAGEQINLSDLMAGKEEIDLAELGGTS